MLISNFLFALVWPFIQKKPGFPPHHVQAQGTSCKEEGLILLGSLGGHDWTPWGSCPVAARAQGCTESIDKTWKHFIFFNLKKFFLIKFFFFFF